MHGLINRSIQCFLRDTYGPDVWSDVAREANLGLASFEAMLIYDDQMTVAVIDAAARVLDRPREAVLEDMGTYLVSHHNVEALRRLLRFGGVGFVDFLHSLDDLQGRGRLAVPELDLPQLELIGGDAGLFTLHCRSAWPGAEHVVMGLLRAMADDYGALVLLDHQGMTESGAIIGITLLDQRFAEGRRFVLASGAA